MSKDIARSMVGVAILLFGVMFVGFDRIAMGEPTFNQNTNSSPATQNSNVAPQRKTKRTPAKPGAPPATADPSMPAPSVTTETPAAEPVPPTPAQKTAQQTQASTAEMLAAEQTDLSGTYTGTFVCDAVGINGETTLTINGNEFTTADGKSGRIVATTTRGYTAVALQVNDATGTAAATTPTILSLRARKSGKRLTLLSPSGETGSCTFTPTATTARSRRTRPVRQAAPVPAATGTEVSSPVGATPAVPDSAGPMPPSSPKSTPGKTKPKTSTGNPPAPKPSPTPPQP
jgi:hypothetical protein